MRLGWIIVVLVSVVACSSSDAPNTNGGAASGEEPPCRGGGVAIVTGTPDGVTPGVHTPQEALVRVFVGESVPSTYRDALLASGFFDESPAGRQAIEEADFDQPTVSWDPIAVDLETLRDDGRQVLRATSEGATIGEFTVSPASTGGLAIYELWYCGDLFPAEGL